MELGRALVDVDVLSGEIYFGRGERERVKEEEKEARRTYIPPLRIPRRIMNGPAIRWIRLSGDLRWVFLYI